MFCRKDNWRICEMMAIRELVACFIITYHMLQLMEVEVWGPVAKQVVKVVRGEIRRLKETVIHGYEKKLKSSYLVLRKGLNMEEKEWPCCCSPKRHHQISQSYQWGVNISKETNLIEKNKKSTMILLCRSFLWEFLDVDARMSSHVEMRRADEGIYYANEVAPRSLPQVIWLIKW